MTPSPIRDRSRKATTVLAQAAAVLLLAACGPGEQAADVAEPPAGAEAAQDQAAAPGAAATPALLLGGEGLRVTAGDGGAARLIAFEAPMAETVGSLTAAFGAAPESSSNEECGSGPMTMAEWDGRLTAFFQEERLVGWESYGQLRTAEGIRVGSTRGELDVLSDLNVEQSTLGLEFTAGGLSGLLQSNAPDAKVTDLWAGDICAFR